MRSDDIMPLRLTRQGLAGPPVADPVAVVRGLAAMQAQEYAVAKWSIAQRCTGVDAAQMERLCASGAILRTHLLRPTWHFVLPEDIRWLLALTAPRVHQANGFMYRREGLDEETLRLATSVLGHALADGDHLTRAELQAALSRAGIEAAGLRFIYILMYAELDAVICSGARRGKQPTYALLDARAPTEARLDPEAALAELTTRYFATRGPATVKDFSRWSGLTMTRCRRGVSTLGTALSTETIDGRTYHVGPGSPPAGRPSPTVDLIQGYDEIVMSYSESRDLLDGGDRPLKPEPLLHTMLRDGRLLGHWRHNPKTPTTLDVQWRRPLDTKLRKAVAAAVDRYAAYLGTGLTWAEV